MVMTTSEREWIGKLVKSQKQAQDKELEELRNRKRVSEVDKDIVPETGGKSVQQILEKNLLDTGRGRDLQSTTDTEELRKERKEEFLRDVFDRVEEGVNTQRIDDKVASTLTRDEKARIQTGKNANGSVATPLQISQAKQKLAKNLVEMEKVEQAVLAEYNTQLLGALGKGKDALTDQDWADHGEEIHKAMAKAVEKVAVNKGLVIHGTAEAYLAHFASRHGPRTTGSEQATRIVTGVAPDKKDLFDPYALSTRSVNVGGGETVHVQEYTRRGKEITDSTSRLNSGEAALYVLEDALSQATELQQLGLRQDFTVDVKKADFDDGFGDSYEVDGSNAPDTYQAINSLNRPTHYNNYGREFDRRSDEVFKTSNVKQAKVVMVATPDGGFAPKTIYPDKRITGNKVLYGPKNSPITVNKNNLTLSHRNQLKAQANNEHLRAKNAATQANQAVVNKTNTLQLKQQAVTQLINGQPGAKAELETLTKAVADLETAKAGQKKIDDARKAVVDMGHRITALANAVNQAKLVMANVGATAEAKKLAQMELQKAQAQLTTVTQAKQQLEEHLSSKEMLEIIDGVDKQLKAAQQTLTDARNAAKNKVKGPKGFNGVQFLKNFEVATGQQVSAQMDLNKATLDLKKAQAYEEFAKSELDEIDPPPTTLHNEKQKLSDALVQAKNGGKLAAVAEQQKGEIDSYKKIVGEEVEERKKKIEEIDKDAESSLQAAKDAKDKLETARKNLEDIKALPGKKKQELQLAQQGLTALNKALPELKDNKEKLEEANRVAQLKASQSKGLYEQLLDTPGTAVKNLNDEAAGAQREAEASEKKAVVADKEAEQLGLKRSDAENKLKEVNALLESARKRLTQLQDEPGSEVSEKIRLARTKGEQARESAAQGRKLMDEIARFQGLANQAKQEREPILKQFHDRQAADKAVAEAMRQLEQAKGEEDVQRAQETLAKAKEAAEKLPTVDESRGRLTVVNKAIRDAEESAQAQAELLEARLKTTAQLEQQAKQLEIDGREAAEQEVSEAEGAVRTLEQQAQRHQGLAEATQKDIEKQSLLARQLREQASTRTKDAERLRQQAEDTRNKELSDAKLSMDKRAEDAQRSSEEFAQANRKLEEQEKEIQSAKQSVSETQKAFDLASKDSVEAIKKAEVQVKENETQATSTQEDADKADRLRKRLKEQAEADTAAEQAEIDRAYAEHELRVATVEKVNTNPKSVLKAKVAGLKVTHQTAIATLAQAQADVTRAKHELPQMEALLVEVQKKVVELDGKILVLDNKITPITNKAANTRTPLEASNLETYQKERGQLDMARQRLRSRLNPGIVDSQMHRKNATAQVANRDLNPLKEAVRLAKEAYEKEAAKL